MPPLSSIYPVDSKSPPLVIAIFRPHQNPIMDLKREEAIPEQTKFPRSWVESIAFLPQPQQKECDPKTYTGIPSKRTQAFGQQWNSLNSRPEAMFSSQYDRTEEAIRIPSDDS